MQDGSGTGITVQILCELDSTIQDGSDTGITVQII